MSTDIDEAVVMALLAHRVTQAQICKYTGISKEAFEERYSYLDADFEYSITRNDAVENAIFAAATTGSVPASISWLKNKAGWDEGKSAAAQQDVDRHVPIEKIQIEVIASKQVKSDEHKADIDSDSDGATS